MKKTTTKAKRQRSKKGDDKPLNVSTMQGDYARIAEGMGAIGIKVSKPDDIGSALKEAQVQNKKGKSVLIEVEANIEQRRSKFQ